MVANRGSLIDIVLLLAFVPGAAWRNPSMAIAVSAAGFVPNSPTNEMIERAAALLAAGERVIMFPEGTRTVPGKLLHFHRGAASVTIRSARQITPVFSRADPSHLIEAGAVAPGARQEAALLDCGESAHRFGAAARRSSARRIAGIERNSDKCLCRPELDALE